MILSIKISSKKFKGSLKFLEISLKLSKGSTLDLKCFTLENIALILALKFKVFQGQLEFFLEIWELPLTLKTLEIFETGNLDFEKTLKFNFNFKEP